MQRHHLCQETSSRIEEDSKNKISRLVCVVFFSPHFETSLHHQREKTSWRNQLVDGKAEELGEGRGQKLRAPKPEKGLGWGEGGICLSQNQFPRPRVHFINQHTDRGTHATAWLGLVPGGH